MPKIYTKTGDKGETSLFGGKRISKGNLRLDAYGTVDELNTMLGVCRSLKLPRRIAQIVAGVQDDLFRLGAELASGSPPKNSVNFLLDHADIRRLEAEIDAIESTLPPLRNFILPGGCQGGAMLHVARTVCRRAERIIVRLSSTEPLRDIPIIYLNRLSDLLFVLARRANASARAAEVKWQPPKDK